LNVLSRPLFHQKKKYPPVLIIDTRLKKQRAVLGLKMEAVRHEYRLKVGVHSKVRTGTKEQLVKKSLSHLQKLQRLPVNVKNYFRHLQISYAA